MKNELKTAFSIYIEKVKSVIENKEAQFEKQKVDDSPSLVYINPTSWLNERINELEKLDEFYSLVSVISIVLGEKPIEKSKNSYTLSYLRNFLRRSGCYLKIWEGDTFNFKDYFDLLWNSFNENEITTTTLYLLDLVYLQEKTVDFGKFKIQKFTKEELDTLCQNKIRRLFYPKKEWDTNILYRFWFIRKEEVKKVPKNEPKRKSSIPCADIDFSNVGKVNRKFPGKVFQQITLSDWKHDLYNGNEDVEEGGWMGFTSPIYLEVNSSLLNFPSFSSPNIKQKTTWNPSFGPYGEEFEKPLQEISLEQNNIKELKRLVKQAHKFSDIKPEQWEFLDIAMGYLAKAFFTDTYENGLEQLLWHMAVLEALFCIKGERPEQIIKKRLDSALGKENTISNEQFKKLYEFRSDLVHGKTESKQTYMGHLWQTRDLARRSVVWFLDYLLDLHDKLKDKIQKEEYPHREEILVSLDFDKPKQKRLKILLENSLKK